MTRTIAIIQARVGSSRLPGKVMLPLLGSPLLAHVVRRVSRATRIDGTVVAITTRSSDDEIEALGLRERWWIVRGSEEDLLDRYVQAARLARADRVVRVTSDCPFVDPAIIDDVIEAHAAAGADYASNSLPPLTYPLGLGVEAMTRVALERAWREDGDPGTREHVTPYLYRHPEIFRLAPVRLDTDLSRHRWTVDTQADYELVRRVYDALGRGDFGWREALAVVEAHPDWSALNRDVPQKPVPRS